MVSRILSLVSPSLVAVSLVLGGCAGSKSSGSSAGGSMASAVDEKAQRLDDARKSAEDAEMKAHQLREEKFRKTSSN